MTGDDTTPIILTECLAVLWKCLPVLAGYQQRDAHEVLHEFLEKTGTHMVQYRMRVRAALGEAKPVADPKDGTYSARQRPC